MARLQLALNVSDLDSAVDFYSKLFDTAPAKVRPGYANFAVAEPPFKLVLIEKPRLPGTLNHLGVEVGDRLEGRHRTNAGWPGRAADHGRGRGLVLPRRAGQGVGASPPTASPGRSTPCWPTPTPTLTAIDDDATARVSTPCCASG